MNLIWGQSGFEDAGRIPWTIRPGAEARGLCMERAASWSHGESKDAWGGYLCRKGVWGGFSEDRGLLQERMENSFASTLCKEGSSRRFLHPPAFDFLLLLPREPFSKKLFSIPGHSDFLAVPARPLVLAQPSIFRALFFIFFPLEFGNFEQIKNNFRIVQVD